MVSAGGQAHRNVRVRRSQTLVWSGHMVLRLCAWFTGVEVTTHGERASSKADGEAWRGILLPPHSEALLCRYSRLRGGVAADEVLRGERGVTWIVRRWCGNRHVGRGEVSESERCTRVCKSV